MFAGLFASIWAKVIAGAVVVALAGGAWWQLKTLIQQNGRLKIENAQLEQTIADKEKEMVLLKDLAAERDRSIEEIAKKQRDVETALSEAEFQLAKRKDAGNMASDYIKEIMRRVRDAESSSGN